MGPRRLAIVIVNLPEAFAGKRSIEPIWSMIVPQAASD
jgi:hypothetical protein